MYKYACTQINTSYYKVIKVNNNLKYIHVAFLFLSSENSLKIVPMHVLNLPGPVSFFTTKSHVSWTP